MPQHLAKIDREFVTQYLKSEKDNFIQYLPRGADNVSFMNSTYLYIMENAPIRDALQTQHGQFSVAKAIILAAHDGRKFGKEAAMVPYSKKIDGIWIKLVRYTIMKEGKIAEAFERGNVKFIVCEEVKEKDEFKLVKTLGKENYHHTPDLKDRGEIVGFYAALQMKDGSSKVTYMTVQEVRDHAERYSDSLRKWISYTEQEQKEKKPPAWVTHFEGQAIKTVIAKMLREFFHPDERQLVAYQNMVAGPAEPIPEDPMEAEDIPPYDEPEDWGGDPV